MTDRELRFKRDDVKPGEAKRFEESGLAVCVVRIGDDFYAIGDVCSHADYSLSEGDVDTDACAIECWKHGSAFSLLDGTPQSLPATKPVPVFPVVADGDDIVVTVK
jgi:3-phenylpropionate/trans-cinnamate dioxygenase ferredoxin subunit